MSFWETLRQALLGRFDRWDPDCDDTVRYLRTQQVLATREAQRLQEVAWEDLFTRKERR